MADLSELFARLKAQSSPSPGSAHPQPYQQPTVSSPIFSPTPGGVQPHHHSAVISPNTSAPNTPAPPVPEQAASDRTVNLLNLLKFNQNASATTPRPIDRRPSHASLQNLQAEGQASSPRPVSASDLVASFMKKPSSSMSMHSPAVASPASGKAEPSHSSSSENPQNLLLRLLNHPKPAQSDAARTPNEMSQVPSQLSAVNGGQEHPIRFFGSDQSADITAFELTTNNPLSGAHPFPNPFEPFHTARSSSHPSVDQGPGRSLLTPDHASSSVRGEPARGTPPNATQEAHITTDRPETVSEAVSGIAEQVEKEVQEALAHVEANEDARSVPRDGTSEKEIQDAVQTAAVEVKRELDDEEVRRAAEEVLREPIVKAIADVADDVIHENVADSWESADAEDSPVKSGGHMIRVYNFPMKPFTSIDIQKLQDPPTDIRQDIIMDIARLKKDFDQIDRNLVVASKHMIVYALTKQGGFRVIRQETGQYRQVFQSSKERIFNLSLCTAIHGNADTETILGTGINGSVFWASVPVPRSEDHFADEDLDQGGFVLPPAPASDDNTSGGQLKTRAKTSFRHPEFFAVGRGKSIHLVYPNVARTAQYTDPKTRVCDTEKYLRERTLKIVTGKAGKDFAFSADDSVIVSLDKAGKMRFWDIRTMIDKAYEVPSGPFEPIQVKTPIMALQTTSPTDKSWPTSVFFLDKERPLSKGIALRYMVVGQKQNHTLQLWDLGLGKAVQELNLPHEKESDAICSVAYHAKTGVMVVGHPTRNSIYFIHVSAPRYNLGAMSQAKYLSSLAEKNASIPKPDSTAIMSGIREYSFSTKGQLRSLYMLDEHASTPDSYPPGDAPIFELYVMHSKGVTVLGIRREDLGWTEEYKVRHPVDAEGSGAIVVNTLRPAQPVTDPSTNGELRTTASSTSRATGRESVKRETVSISRGVSQTPEAAMRASTLAKVESKQDAERAAILNGAEKTDRKKKKRAGDTVSQNSTTSSRPSQTVAPSTVGAGTGSYAQAAQRPKSPPSKPTSADEAAAPVNSNSSISADKAPSPQFVTNQGQPSTTNIADDAFLKDIADRVTTEFTAVLSDRLDLLYQRFNEDKRVQDAAGSAKMDAILRLVSSTLSENVEKSLSRIINHNFTSVVLPGLSENVIGLLDRRMSEAFHTAITTAVTTQMPSSLSDAIGKAMLEPDSLRIISDLVANKVAVQVEGSLDKAVTPALTTICSEATRQIATEVEHRVTEQLRRAEVQHQEDVAKIVQLTGMVKELTESVRTLAAAQNEYQREIMALQRQLNYNREAAGNKGTPNTAQVITGDEEVDAIARMIANGQYEEGTIKWIQSPRQAELFDILFVRCNPVFLRQLSPLVALSVSAAVTSSLESNLAERLLWLEAVLGTINPMDPEIIEVSPKIMDVLCNRLQAAYMQLSEAKRANTQLLGKISELHRKAADLRSQQSLRRGQSTYPATG